MEGRPMERDPRPKRKEIKKEGKVRKGEKRSEREGKRKEEKKGKREKERKRGKKKAATDGGPSLEVSPSSAALFHAQSAPSAKYLVLFFTHPHPHTHQPPKRPRQPGHPSRHNARFRHHAEKPQLNYHDRKTQCRSYQCAQFYCIYHNLVPSLT